MSDEVKDHDVLAQDLYVEDTIVRKYLEISREGSALGYLIAWAGERNGR